MFEQKTAKNDLGHFPSVAELLPYEPGIGKLRDIIATLMESFDSRFEDFRNFEHELRLFENPFSVSPESCEDGDLQLELIDVQSNTRLKDLHAEGNLVKFYQALDNADIPRLKGHAYFVGSMFAGNYGNEQSFSVVKMVKSASRNRLRDASRQLHKSCNLIHDTEC